MQEEYKKNIQRKFQTLIQDCNVDPLLHYLFNKEIFTEDMIRSIKKLNGKEKGRKFFLDIQSRGPKAFENLINGLIETNQYNLAIALDHRKEFIPEKTEKNGQSGPRPFTLPNYCSTQAIKELHKLHPTYNISLKEEPLKVSVTRSINFDHENPGKHKSPIYYTRSKNRGCVKIINIYNVAQEKPRRGSEFDVLNLTSLFKQMGMTVDTSIDLNGVQIKEEVNKFVRNDKLKEADIAILVIMSHGGVTTGTNHEFFYSTDRQEVLTSYVENLFSNENCVYMQNKPKIIIYQICRGPIHDIGVKPRRIETDGVANYNLPTVSDILIVHSTLKDYKSHRDTFVGAWFIQLLCEVFMKDAHDTNVEEMLKVTQNILRRQISGDNTMQTPEYNNKSFNVCYLNPGIYMDNGRICQFEQQF